MEESLEKKLIEQAKQGSSEAFEKLIIEYEKKIYAICLRILKDEHQAYDAAQEVCVKVWKQLEHFEGSAKLSTWIYRIATNQCLDIIRKNKRQETQSLYHTDKLSGEEWEEEERENKEDPIQTHMEQVELRDIMAIALEEIKVDYKTILVLRDMKGYSYEEISKALDLSIGTVKSRLSRARGAIKALLLQDKEPYRSFFRHMNKREEK